MQDKNRIKTKRWAYLAGLVDGDGSFSIRRNSVAGFQLTLYVYSTNRNMMTWLERVFGGQHRKMPTEGNRKQKYCWYSNDASTIRNVSPFLVVKVAQGQTACQFLDLESDRNPSARQDLMSDLQSQNTYFSPLPAKEIVKATLHQTPTKNDFAYLAGLFDAEGSFSIWQKAKRGNGEFESLARISNTDGRIFPWLYARFQGNYCVTLREDRDEGTWKMNGPNRENNTLAIIPYLVIKRERAIIFLEWMRNVRTYPRETKLLKCEIMRKLNLRGLSPTTNTANGPENGLKIESELYGDMQSEPVVTLAS